MPRPARTVAALVAIAAASVTACVWFIDHRRIVEHVAIELRPRPPAASSASGVSGTVTVLAAASLTEAFTTLAKQFEAANPGVKVKLSVRRQFGAGHPDHAGRSGRRVRLRVEQEHEAGDRRGRCVDVDELRQERHGDRGAAEQPGQRHGVNDLAKSGVKVALCQAQVPVRRDRAEGLRQRQDHRQAGDPRADVKSTLAKVETQ
jgi:molybdate transport system substrate-binding protein